MDETSPFEETLFLDVDTEVLGKLDFGFDRAAKFGLACRICEAPYATRFEKAGLPAEAIEYNTGVRTQAGNDQASFAKAVHDLDFHPFVFPPNWNFRTDFQKSFFGPIKIWHALRVMPDELRQFNNMNRPPNVMRFGSVNG